MKIAEFYNVLDEKTGFVQCYLCAHYCKIKDGRKGVCGVRVNNGGKLYTFTWGMAQSAAIDPIEKKPFYHFKPGTKVLSFGTPGCNFSCLNCQNSTLSQAIKEYEMFYRNSDMFMPDEIVKTAIERKVDGIAYTYSEPTIFFEYARDIIEKARMNPESEDLFHLFISNGYFSNELLDTIINNKLLDAVNIDLKFSDDRNYRKVTGGSAGPVKNSIRRLWEAGIHVEVINLVIPGINDNEEEFKKISDFVASVSTDIPLHFSRFYPNYEMTDVEATPLDKLLLAKETARESGLSYVYIGNTSLPGSEDTFCPSCGELLVKRKGFSVSNKDIKLIKTNAEFHCPGCGERIYMRM